jgi:hypothetical protein
MWEVEWLTRMSLILFLKYPLGAFSFAHDVGYRDASVRGKIASTLGERGYRELVFLPGVGDTGDRRQAFSTVAIACIVTIRRHNIRCLSLRLEDTAVPVTERAKPCIVWQSAWLWGIKHEGA